MTTCNDCHWWAPISTRRTVGACRQSAPPWPDTKAADTCGGFKAKGTSFKVTQTSASPIRLGPPGPMWIDCRGLRGVDIATPQGRAPMPSNAEWIHPVSFLCMFDDGQLYEFDGSGWTLHHGAANAVYVAQPTPGNVYHWTTTADVTPDVPPPAKTADKDDFLNPARAKAEALHKALTGDVPVDTDPDAMRRRIERATRDLSGG